MQQRSFLRRLFLGAGLAAALALPAKELSFQKAPWSLKIDDQNGSLLELKWKGKTISRNTVNMPLVKWGPGWIAGSDKGPVKLLSHQWDAAKGILTLHTKITDYKVDEIITLGYNGDADLAAVAVELTYAPADAKAKPEKMQNLACVFPVSSDAKYLLPAKRDFLDKSYKGVLKDIPQGKSYRSMWGVPPTLIELDPELSVIFMPEYRKDIAESSVSRDTVAEVAAAAGWLYPGQTQHIGPFYVGVYAGPIQAALEKRVWTMYDAIDFKAVKDTPDWFRDNALYSFGAGGSTGAGGMDLGGFDAARKELLPRISQLGFGTIWMLPIDDGNGGRGYWPRDYYKVNDTLGTEEELKTLVDAIHAAKMRVLFDCVPHGGTPGNAAIRGSKPWQLCYKADGSVNGYWCFDFGDPDWQKYIGEVVYYHMKKYDIDGYRIDAIIGNNTLNWRSQDFPTQRPSNVDKNWWEKSLRENGGKMPPLAYERGSLGCRQGGLGMLRSIHSNVQKGKRDGAVLAEVDHAPYMVDADCIFNFPLALTLCETAVRMPKDAWATALTRWLDDTNFVNPRGSRWLQYFGSHDHLTPYNFVGFGATRTLIGYTFLLDGIPMVYQDQDLGIGPFLKRMIAVRKALVELHRGEGRYCSPAPGVLASFRYYEKDCSIGLANPGADPIKVKLGAAVPADTVRKGTFNLWSSDAEKPVFSGSWQQLMQKSVTLKPFSCTVYAFRKAGEKNPFPAEEKFTPAPAVETKSAFAVAEKPFLYEITAPGYKAGVSRSTGMIEYFTDASGKKLLSGAGFISELSPELRRPANIPDMQVSIKSQSADKVEILAQAGLGNGGWVNLVYTCTPEKITVLGVLYHADKEKRAALVLKGEKIDRWQVASAEGLIDDHFMSRHQYGIPNVATAEGVLYYRLGATPVMWQSVTNPLDFNRPVMTAFAGNHGVQLNFKDLLANAPANVAALDKFTRRPGWYTAIYWKDLSPYPWQSAAQKTCRFTFDLSPCAAPLAERTSTAWTTAGNVKFRNVSQGWEVKTGSTTLLLHRCGGILREVRNRRGQVVIDRTNVCTTKGFRRRWGSPNQYGSSDNDGETGVTIHEANGKLVMRFDHALRIGRRSWLIEPIVWGYTEYTFDGTDNIGVKWNFRTGGAPKDPQVFAGWEFYSSAWNIGRFYKGGQELARHEWLDNRKLDGKPIPDKADFCGDDGRVLFTLNDIRCAGDGETVSLVKTPGRFIIAAYDGPAKGVKVDHDYEGSFTLSVK